MFLAGLYYRNSVQQKLRLASMREKISQNLHDDIGASISSLHIYSTLAQDILPDQPQKVAGLLAKMTEQSSRLMENMNDMVWSMRTDKDVMPLGTRIKNFGLELLAIKEIRAKYEIDEELFSQFRGFEERKNILLIIKEAMNNIAKYSGATQAVIGFTKSGENQAILRIEDNGSGVDLNNLVPGNGLKNMEARSMQLKGNFSIVSKPKEGMTIQLIIPIP
jgi:signal transduction histidine kinase